MCKIRLITKDKQDNVVHDEFIEVLSDNVNVVDKPFYAICYFDKNEIVLEYNFMNNNEDNSTFIDKDIQIKYGKTSGRIYSFKVFKLNNLEDTTIFRIKEAILSCETRSERFKSTFIQFISISKILILNSKKHLN